MRVLFILALFIQVAAFAQPGSPDLCFVVAEPGKALRPLKRAITVLQRYEERVPYVGFDGSWLKPAELPLQPSPLFQTGEDRWEVYHPVQGMANSVVLSLQVRTPCASAFPKIRSH